MPRADGRRLPVGAEVRPKGTHFRVWAPRCARVELLLEDRGRTRPLEAEGDGYFSVFAAGAGHGMPYRLRLDGGEAYPDPASRFQPRGVHGPSAVVDPARYRWRDDDWPGVPADGNVLYELHAGTFTREGTWAAASAQLPALADTGITVIEVMPVAEFAGDFGWGYDGVDLFAPTRLYGEPDDLRRFVDDAHATGLGVILDVVYNHFGPAGNYIGNYSDDYFTDRYENEWGAAINFDGDGAGPVREFFLANARYWIEEFHFDGLRFDATQSMHDASASHIVAELAETVRAAAKGRRTLVIAENEPQDARLARPASRGGFGVDALWNDDFHHTARVAATGRAEAYYCDYGGTPQELISALRHGFLYQGQRYAWQDNRRGTPAWDLPPRAFVHYLQNHDQIANSATGERLHHLTSPGRWRALTALLLLGPQTPLLFQGQEFAASSPFLYFADHEPDLARRVAEGRREFLSQFPSIAQPAVLAALPDPGDRRTFERCRLDHRERKRHAHAIALHRDLLRLRRGGSALAGARAKPEGAVLAPSAFALRWFDPDGDDRLLIVNLGAQVELVHAPEPLLAPPPGASWRTLWSSDDPRYGGAGAAPPETEAGWTLAGEAAVLLGPSAGQVDDASSASARSSAATASATEARSASARRDSSAAV